MGTFSHAQNLVKILEYLHDNEEEIIKKEG